MLGLTLIWAPGKFPTSACHGLVRTRTSASITSMIEHIVWRDQGKMRYDNGTWYAPHASVTHILIYAFIDKRPAATLTNIFQT